MFQARNELAGHPMLIKLFKASSSSIHMCLICNDFQMWVVWLHSLASSAPKTVFGIAQSTLYLNTRQTVRRGRKRGLQRFQHNGQRNLSTLMLGNKTDYKRFFIAALLTSNTTVIIFVFLRFHLLSRRVFLKWPDTELSSLLETKSTHRVSLSMVKSLSKNITVKNFNISSNIHMQCSSKCTLKKLFSITVQKKKKKKGT